MINLLAIVGPTASGKTALSIDIAKKYQGEIIAADSRTIYRFMDIGTAKPTLSERGKIPHWGLDLVGPGQKMTVADFKIYANKKIKEIRQREHLPILVGGSGLYIDAVLYDFNFAPANTRLREALSAMSIEELQDNINKSGLKMPQNCLNKRYLIRTLEKGNANTSKKQLGDKTLIIGINPGKELLKQRIIERAKKMVNNGVIEEVAFVADKYGWKSEAMTGGVYRSFKPLIEGNISPQEAFNNLVASDIKLTKKQMTWFKRNSDINWFSSTDQAMDWFAKHNNGKLK